LLANYFAASAAPAIPSFAIYPNFAAAALASSTPSTNPFFKFAILSLILLTTVASHLHLSPFLKVPSKLSFKEANNLFADLFLLFNDNLANLLNKMLSFGQLQSSRH
jgi:hypothetical protein